MSDVSQAQANQVLLWKTFYWELFKFNLKEALIPEPEPEFDQKWLIIREPRFTAQDLFDRIQELYGAWLWTGRNLDSVLNQRDSVRSAANFPYGVWVEAGEDPDEDLRNKSGNDLKYLGITLEERFFLDIFYWWRTRQHLDRWYRTLCSGTSYDNGGMPCMGWDERNNQLIVDCNFLPNLAHKKYCVRKVIAAPEIPMLGTVLH